MVPLPLRSALAFLGHNATRTYAASIFLGLALPWLASAVRPLLPVTIVIIVGITFARADLSGLRRAVAQPGRLATALIWSTLAMPVLIGTAVLAIGREAFDPGLLLGLSLIAAAPPLMAAPVYAALLGFESSLVLTLLVSGMAVTPLLAPPMASLIAGAAVPLDPASLALRLAILLGLAGGLAIAIRRLAGPAKLKAAKIEIDGLIIFLFFIFAIAAMDGVLALTIANPWRTLLYTAVAFAVTGIGFGVTLVALRWMGADQAFAVGIGIGLRNTGLLVAPLGAAMPPDGYLFFSILQFPIYLAPLIVAPLAAMTLGKSATRVAPPPPQ